MYVVSVTFDIFPDRMDEFMPLMLSNAATSRVDEPGCRQFDVCRNGTDPRVFLYEVYDNADAFQQHLETSHFKEFDKAAASMIQHKTVAVFDEVHQ